MTNAFDVLMKTAKEQNDIFYMEIYDGVVKYNSIDVESRWSSNTFNSCITRMGRRITTRLKLNDCRTTERIAYQPKINIPSLPIHVIKSALQKNVRLGNVNGAVNIGWLCTCNPNGLRELLRRLPIIAIEDAIIPPNFNNVVWLMLASYSNSYQYTKHDIQDIIKFIYLIASVKFRDPMLEDVPNAPVFSTQNDSLINSIIVRESFGGMKGDMKMLRCAAHYWSTHEMTTNLCDSYNKVFDISLPDVFEHSGSIISTDIPLSAVDFHCSSVLDNLTDLQYAMEDVKRAMWICSSSLNVKTDWKHATLLRTGEDSIHAFQMVNKLQSHIYYYDAANEDEKIWASVHVLVRRYAKYIQERVISQIVKYECVL